MQYVNGLIFDIGYSRMYSQRMTIGNRLDKAMQDAKIQSQSALQRISGVPQATISRILKGNGTKGPETETVRKLAAACNVTFEWLNEGIGSAGRATQGKQAQIAVQEPANSDALSPEEITELVNVYCGLGAKERRIILKSAKAAFERAGRGKIAGSSH